MGGFLRGPLQTFRRSDAGPGACSKGQGAAAATAAPVNSHCSKTSALSEIAAGDIVECIDDTPSRPESQIMPVRGGLYAVASIRFVDDGQSVRLKELTPICYLGGVCACNQCGWDAGRFRKVHRPGAGLLARLMEKAPEPA